MSLRNDRVVWDSSLILCADTSKGKRGAGTLMRKLLRDASRKQKRDIITLVGLRVDCEPRERIVSG